MESHIHNSFLPHNFIKKSLDAGVAFYACRLPDSITVKYGYCHPDEVISIGNASIPNREGFIIAPFQQTDGTTLFIPSSNTVFNTDSVSAVNEVKDLRSHLLYAFPQRSTTHDQHLASVAKAVESLRTMPQGSKVVISRVLLQQSDIDPDSVFMSLSEAYKSSFIFCFNTPQSGLWIGATPETLLSVNNNKLMTMALAGTRLTRSNGDWDAKNIEEQEIVTRYICSTLSAHGLIPETSPRYTKQAGPVEHLCTPITATISGTEDRESQTFDLLSLLADLSPTPALGGFPKDYALATIKEIEHHDRAYYGGYCGIIGNNDAQLFVNLRSMWIHDGKCCLYAGGGITRHSDPESEWIETERKASTMLRFLTRD